MPTPKISSKATLFLIPTTLSPTIDHHILTDFQLAKIKHLQYFIVETPKVARCHLKQLGLNTPLQDLTVYELNKHQQKLDDMLKPLLDGHDIGLISDCGMPAIADPGSTIVRAAHEHGIKVTPLAGSSSILMALMASGVNGQLFAFNGYVPIEHNDRINYIKHMQDNIIKYKQSQIFIEAPFRNQQLLQTLIATLNNNITLCLAINLMSDDEQIISHPISQWTKIINTPINLPLVNKQEVVFVIGILGAVIN